MAKHIQTMVDHWLKLFICSVFLLNVELAHGALFVNLTFIESAVSKGAVCLDGSPAAYSYAEGFGEGVNSWVVFFEGGGWCTSKLDCLERSKGNYGSNFLKSRSWFEGILDNNKTFNPDFYNWNRVFVTYCDGASFMADIEEVDPETNIRYRGARIFDVVMEDLLAKGMNNADNAILSGGSAGGLTTILHCDKFRELIPNASRVKCISDSGFFIHGEKLTGAEFRAEHFAHVVETHELTKYLPKECTSKMDPGLCLFPENLVRHIKTPLFLVEAGFERWQIEEQLIPVIGGKAQWSNCTSNLTLCTPTEIQYMKDFRAVFIDTLLKAIYKSPFKRGLFVHSCYRHGHITRREGWTCSPVVGKKTIGKAIGDWYFDRSPFKAIDLQNDVPRNCTIPTEELVKKCVLNLD